MASNPYATGAVAVNPEHMAQYMKTHQPPTTLFPHPAYSARPVGYVPSNAMPLLPGFYPYTAIMMQQQQQIVAQPQLSSSKEAFSKQSTPVTTAIPPLAPASQPTIKTVSTITSTKKHAPRRLLLDHTLLVPRIRSPFLLVLPRSKCKFHNK